MMTIRVVCVSTVRIIAGVLIIFFSGDMLHDEFYSPHRSLIVCGVLAAAVVIGALMMPMLGTEVQDAGDKGFRLFSLGRRAYDGKPIPEVEIPKTEDIK